MTNNGRNLLFALLLALLLGKNIHAEVALGNVVSGPAPHLKAEPAVASDGRDYLAVWRDQRTGRTEELIAARIAANGTVLDPHGIRIGNNRPASNPRVVFLGDAYQIFWSTWSTSQGSGALWVARVGRDGRVLTQPRAIANGPSMLGSFVATNGSVAVAAYAGEITPAGVAIHSVTLDANANVLGYQHLTPPNVNRYHISVAKTGDGFLAAWNSFHQPSSQIEAVRLNADGEPLDAQPRLLGAGYDPELAGDGTHSLAVIRHASGNSLDVSTRLVRNDLEWVSPARTVPGPQLSDVQVVKSGAEYLMVATAAEVQSHAVLATRINAEGLPVFASTVTMLPNSAVTSTPRVASNGTDMLVVWIEANAEVTQGFVRAQRIAPQSLDARGGQIELARSAQPQFAPAIATDGAITLAAWLERGSIYAQRGNDTPVELGRGTTAPRVVFDGRNFIVAWSDFSANTVNARFIDRATGALGDELREVTQTPGAVALATNGAMTLLAWSRGETRQIVAVRLGRESQRIETVPSPLSPDDMRAEGPVAAWNGREFLAAWSELEYIANDDSPHTGGWVPQRIRGTRVNEGLLPLDPPSRILGDTRGSDSGASLASSGGEWMLVWTSFENRSVIRARRLRDDLTGHGSPSGVRTSEGESARVVFDGERYVIAINDGRIAYLTNEGVAHQPYVVRPAEPIHSIDLAPIAPGRVAVTYDRISWAPEHGGVSRAFLTLVQLRTKSRTIR